MRSSESEANRKNVWRTPSFQAILPNQVNVFHKEREIIEENGREIHMETASFIRKYFSQHSLTSDGSVSISQLIESIIGEYQELWEGQQIDKIIDKIEHQMGKIFGFTVNIQSLIEVTRKDGMIGLIMSIFKEIAEMDTKEMLDRLKENRKGSRESPVKMLESNFQDYTIEGETEDNVEHLKGVIGKYIDDVCAERQREINDRAENMIAQIERKCDETEKLLAHAVEKLKYLKANKESDRVIQNHITEMQKALVERDRRISQLEMELQNEKEKKVLISNNLEENKEELKLLKIQKQKYETVLLNKMSEQKQSEYYTSVEPRPQKERENNPVSTPIKIRTSSVSNLQAYNRPFANFAKPTDISRVSQIQRGPQISRISQVQRAPQISRISQVQRAPQISRISLVQRAPQREFLNRNIRNTLEYAPQVFPVQPIVYPDRRVSPSPVRGSDRYSLTKLAQPIALASTNIGKSKVSTRQDSGTAYNKPR